jgi:O-antigen ligase
VDKVKPILSYLCVLPTILLICTVLIVDNSIPQGIVLGQAFWASKVMSFTSIFVLISYLVNKKTIHSSFTDLLFLLFIASGIGITWFVAKEFTPKMMVLVYIGILYLLLKILIHQKRNTFFFFIIILMMTGLFEAIWGLKQLYGFTYSQHSLFKTTGSFYNPGPYAGYLAMIAPVALHYCLRYWHCFHKIIQIHYLKQYCVLSLSVITLTFIWIVLPSTGSRASWLAVIIGCTVILTLNQRDIVLWLKNNTKKMTAYFLIGSILLAFTVYGLYAFKKNSADGRLLIWKNTITQIKDNPTGVGVGFYAGNYGKYQAEYFKKGGTDEEKMLAGSPEYAFNEYLQIAAEFGVIPFLLFMTVILNVIISAIKNRRVAPLGALISLLVFAAMSYPFSLVPFILSFVLLLILCTYSPLASDGENRKTKIQIPVFLSILCAIPLMIYLTAQADQLYKSYQSWGSIRYLYYTKSYANAKKSYSKEYDNLKDNVEYLFEYGQILSNLKDYRQSNAVLKRATILSGDPMLINIIGKNYQALKDFDRAAEYYTQALYTIPHRLYPHYLLAQLYIENNDLPKAQLIAEKLLSIPIKISSPAINQMRKEMQSFMQSFE